MPKLELTLTWEAFSGPQRQGKPTSRKTEICRSYLRALIDMMAASWGLQSLTVVDTAGSSQTYAGLSTGYGPYINCAANSSAYGLVVGTGTTAVTIADNKLATQITHGVAAGQLQHGATSVLAPSTSGSTRLFTVTRTFTNGSGGTVTVTEVGIYSRTQSYGYYLCLERTLSTQAIADAASATATYTISVTV